jgi:hypothetical protein
MKTVSAPPRAAALGRRPLVSLSVFLALSLFGATYGQAQTYKVRYSNFFENSQNGSDKYSFDRLNRSPRDLPQSRVTRVQDPVGQRGMVMAVKWITGDDYRTSPGTKPRSWVSSAEAFTFDDNDVVKFTWGFMARDTDVRAYIAQNIADGGPVWMVQVDRNGKVLFSLHGPDKTTNRVYAVDFTIKKDTWTDFRVELKLTDNSDGWVKFWINNEKKPRVDAQNTKFGPSGAPGSDCHFDCGIYNKDNYTSSNPGPTRTVYFSDLTISKQ